MQEYKKWWIAQEITQESEPSFAVLTSEVNGGILLQGTLEECKKWIDERVEYDDVAELAKEVATAIRHRREDERLKWYQDGRVQIIIGRVLPDGSAVEQTLSKRRKWFWEELEAWLTVEGWRKVELHVYVRA